MSQESLEEIIAPEFLNRIHALEEGSTFTVMVTYVGPQSKFPQERKYWGNILEENREYLAKKCEYFTLHDLQYTVMESFNTVGVQVRKQHVYDLLIDKDVKSIIEDVIL